MTYRIAPGTSHIYIQDQQGNYVAKSFDDSRENFQRIEGLISAANSVAGIPDPAAALKAAREAIQSFLEIGKRDLTNPKYDGYFVALRQALEQLNREQP